MAWLNEHLAGCQVCADSPMDGIWLRELANAAGIAPAFALVDIVTVFEGPEIDQAARPPAEVHADRVEPKTHRAEQDARHLAARYVGSLDLDVGNYVASHS